MFGKEELASLDKTEQKGAICRADKKIGVLLSIIRSTQKGCGPKANHKSKKAKPVCETTTLQDGIKA